MSVFFMTWTCPLPWYETNVVKPCNSLKPNLVLQYNQRGVILNLFKGNSFLPEIFLL